MKKIVLRFGLISGLILITVSATMMSLTMSKAVDFEMSEVVGYSSMVLAFLMVFFGVKSYRDNVAGGTIGFGKAFQVGILITLITCAIYVVAWEITYFNFYPDFLDQYTAHCLEKMRADGETEAAILKKTAELAAMAKYYDNPLYNSAITFMEIFPVGLIVTLVTAGILRRKPSEAAPASALTA